MRGHEFKNTSNTKKGEEVLLLDIDNYMGSEVKEGGEG